MPSSSSLCALSTASSPAPSILSLSEMSGLPGQANIFSSSNENELEYAVYLESPHDFFRGKMLWIILWITFGRCQIPAVWAFLRAWGYYYVCFRVYEDGEEPGFERGIISCNEPATSEMNMSDPVGVSTACTFSGFPASSKGSQTLCLPCRTMKSRII